MYVFKYFIPCDMGKKLPLISIQNIHRRLSINQLLFKCFPLFCTSFIHTENFLFDMFRTVITLNYLQKTRHLKLKSLWNLFCVNVFSFDVFTVCHSLGQSVTDIALYIPQENSFSSKV